MDDKKTIPTQPVTTGGDGPRLAGAGRTIGHYRIVEELGRGGMGVVYLAEHQVMGRQVALKLLGREGAAQAQAAERFLNEARTMALLRHPAFVDVLDCGHTADGQAYIVMERLEGEPLDRRLAARGGRLPVAEAVALVREVAAAISVAHANGVIHRDLKPSNVFLARAPEDGGGEIVKVLDFGIAKLTDATANPIHTVEGALMGTPHYMAPEQCRGRDEIDARADVYALGCLLYAVICGRPPFDDRTPGELIAAHIHEVPAPPSTLQPAVPPALDAVILQALAKEPADRPASAAALADALGAALAAPPPGPAPRPRRRRILVGAAGLGISAAAGVGLWARRSRRRAGGPGGPSWRAVALSPQGAPAYDPDVAFDEAGRGLVAWREIGADGRTSLWAVRLGEAPGPGIALAAPAASLVVAHAATLGPRGEGAVLWTEAAPDVATGDGGRLRARRLSPAGDWSGAEPLGPPAAEPPSGFDVAVDPVGTLHAVWIVGEAGRYTVWAARGAPGAGFGPPEVIFRGPGAADGLHVSAERPGRALAVWGETDRMRRAHLALCDGGRWTMPPAHLEDASHQVEAPKAALTAEGAFLVWRELGPASARLRVRHFVPARGWGEPVDLGETSFGGLGEPKIAIAEDGAGLVVSRWRQGLFQSVAAWRFAAGRWETAPSIISAGKGLNAGRPQLAMDRAGRAVALWAEHDETFGGLWVRRFHPATGWAEAEPVAEKESPGVIGEAALGGGRAAVAWIRGRMNRAIWLATSAAR